MSRTPEQKEADEALTKAIDAAVSAYGFNEKGLINTQYLVIVEQRGWADSGDSLSAFVSLYKDGDMGWSAILGLLRAATLRAEKNYFDSVISDDDSG